MKTYQIIELKICCIKFGFLRGAERIKNNQKSVKCKRTIYSYTQLNVIHTWPIYLDIPRIYLENYFWSAI